MILDNARNLKFYAALDPRLLKVAEFIEKFDASPLEPGKYEIDGKDLFVNIMDKDNGPNADKQYEIHHNYADLQYIHKGGQRIYWRDAVGLPFDEKYNAEKDVAKLALEGGIACDLKAGEFVLVYPEDAHRPDCEYEGAPHALKFVFKLKVK